MNVKTLKPDLLIRHPDGRRASYPLGHVVDLDESTARQLIERGQAEPAPAEAEDAADREATPEDAPGAEPEKKGRKKR